MNTKKYTSALELLFATLIWGFGFTATIWALKAVDSATMTVLRFGVAFAVGFAILKFKYPKEVNKTNLILGAFPGLTLGLMIMTQTWGLEYTSVTNSGFITTLYVVLVPLMDRLLFRVHVDRWHSLWVIMAIIGTALMINVQKMTTLNKGDLLTIVTAILAALQIVWIGRISPKITSALALNTYQSLWGALGAMVFWPIYGNAYLQKPDPAAWIGLFSLTFGSTLIGFALQVKAQKHLSSSTASVIFLLESPFAALFGIWLLNETISPLQTLGGFLIFISAYGSVAFSRKTKY
jgi:drug/metabolite transporter (DMT)-like permease